MRCGDETAEPNRLRLCVDGDDIDEVAGPKAFGDRELDARIEAPGAPLRFEPGNRHGGFSFIHPSAAAAAGADNDLRKSRSFGAQRELLHGVGGLRRTHKRLILQYQSVLRKSRAASRSTGFLRTRHPVHILEGYLPLTHAVGWTVASAPFVIRGYRAAVRMGDDGRDARFTLAAAAAFTLLLSSLKIPSVAGSSSHPTGTALGTLLVGLPVMALVSLIVLLFQTLLLAHGGLTTLGANVFSMGVVGPWVALMLYRGSTRLGAPLLLAAAVAATGGDLATYLTTSAQLAFAHPEAGGSFTSAFLRFASVFGVTQLPIAVLEGGLTVLVLRALPLSAWNRPTGTSTHPRTFEHQGIAEVRP